VRAYVIRRLLLIIPTLFLVTFLIFSVVRFLPGNVIEMMVSQMGRDAQVSGEEMEITIDWIKQRLGMDVPVYVQYVRWLGVTRNVDGEFAGIFQGNLGVTLWKQIPVLPEILRRMPVSAELGALAILIGLSIAIPLGTLSAIRQDTMVDYGGRGLAIAGISLPQFWVGTMVVVYPSIWFNWSPSVELIPLTENVAGNLVQFAVPAVVLGMLMSGATMRMTRSMVLEVLRQDYIRTAWAKGLRERSVIVRHTLKNALIPVITQIGLQIPVLVAGTIVIEQIFALPGMGRLFIEALNTRDYPIIQGINLIIAVLVLLLNLLVDLAYAWLDPRVSYK
jgi:peptide/nickel transport system permease protein